MVPSSGSLVVFVLIVAAVVGGFLAGVAHTDSRRATLKAAGMTAAWMALTAAVPLSGVLEMTLPGPPPALGFFALITAGAVGLARSGTGRKLATGLPLWALIGGQSFRLPLELVLHQWWAEGVVPVQMTYRGENLDILTGVLALLAGLGLWRGWLGRRAAVAVNLVGAALLLNVVRVVLRTADTPLRVVTDEPVLTLVNHVPTVWIASVCVAGAMALHLMTLQRLHGAQAAGVQRDAA